MSELVVWKYDIPMEDQILIRMPRGARIIHFANQPDNFERKMKFSPNGSLKIWALVDIEQPSVNHSFRLVGTGQGINLDSDRVESFSKGEQGDDLRIGEVIPLVVIHRGTVLLQSGDLVLHLFEICLFRPLSNGEDHDRYAVYHPSV